MRKFIKLDHLDNSNKNTLCVNWNLTNRCNYDCRYCLKSIHDGSIKDIDIEAVLKFCKKLLDYNKTKGRDVFIELNGGEVTIHPHIEEIIYKIKALGGKTGIVTNGSAKLDFWKRNLSNLDSVILSYHSKYSKVSHMIDVIKLLETKKTIKVHVNVMMDPNDFDQCYQSAIDLKKKTLVSISLQRLLENHITINDELYPYSKKQKNLMIKFKNKKFFNRSIKKAIELFSGSYPYNPRGKMRKVFTDDSSEICSTDQLITKGEINFKGWKCSAGLQNLAIYWNGDVLRGQCFTGGVLFNIKGESFNLPDDNIICDKKSCGCGFDLLCTKIKVIGT